LVEITLLYLGKAAQPRVKLTRLQLWYVARILLSFFRVKSGCLCQIGGQLTPTLEAFKEISYSSKEKINYIEALV